MVRIRPSRMGKWKAVFQGKKSHLGKDVLLFDTQFRNGIEERTSVAGEHPEIVQQIRRLLDESVEPRKYLTLDP